MNDDEENWLFRSRNACFPPTNRMTGHDFQVSLRSPSLLVAMVVVVLKRVIPFSHCHIFGLSSSHSSLLSSEWRVLCLPGAFLASRYESTSSSCYIIKVNRMARGGQYVRTSLDSNWYACAGNTCNVASLEQHWKLDLETIFFDLKLSVFRHKSVWSIRKWFLFYAYTWISSQTALKHSTMSKWKSHPFLELQANTLSLNHSIFHH